MDITRTQGSSGNPPRNTSVVVVVLESSEVYIVVSLSTRNDTQVIFVDPTTGSLGYRGRLGLEVFISEEEALKHITDGSSWICKSITYASAILGYGAFGSYGLLLVATKLEATIPNFPGGGCVYTVSESQWIRIPLQYPQPQGRGELKNVQELCDVDIDGKHYFCETRDITRPFPSQMPFDNPDREFVWNEFLSKPFKDIGLPKHCVILLQGFAECRSLGQEGQREGMLALTARRSRLHPGTRYLARGLNACFSTGNEVECEQLVWTSSGSSQVTTFSSHIWRRGTVPIWWGAELKLTAAEAEIYVSSQDPYQGTVKYYDRLSKRYGKQNSDSVKVKDQREILVPIVCVNLLRNEEGKSETRLVKHFSESLNYVKSSRCLSNTELLLINYDWHASVRLNGEQKTIETFWKLLKSPTVGIGFSEGIYVSSLQQLRNHKGITIFNKDVEGGFCLKTVQTGVIRFNCADSLDRTNAASYFGCLQVFAEQCKRLGISLEKDTAFEFHMNRPRQLNASARVGGSLPSGWEERSDAVTGKIFYIDHNTRTTTWEHPCPDRPWKRFDMTFEQFKDSTKLYPITQLSELFQLAGDIHATLYTGSKATHNQILNIFNNDSGKFRQFATAQHVKITLQRRYKNVVVDSHRQKQLEMFLGIRMFKHLPSIAVHPLQVLSRPPAFFLKPLGSIFPNLKGEPDLLNFKRKGATWVSATAADVIELFIYLEEPCHVCQILLTLSHGGDESSFPGMIDVRTGCTLDELKLVLEGACLPQCSNGTNLLIPLAGAMNPEDFVVTGGCSHLNTQENAFYPLLYNFEEAEGELNFLTRIVALTFYPSNTGRCATSLGEIEILGVSLPWRNIFLGQCPLLCDSAVSDVTNSFQCSDIRSSECCTSNERVPQMEKVDVFKCMKDSPSVVEPIESTETSVPRDFQNDQPPNFSSRIQHYLDCFRRLSSQGHELKFLDAMNLEIERLQAKVSAAERDRALLSVSVIPSTADPNFLIDEPYLFKLSKLADDLAFVGHSSLEDSIIASTGVENLEPFIDFWNLHKPSATCLGQGCEVKALNTALISCQSQPMLFVCSICNKKACMVCCAGRGAALISGFYSKEAKNLSSSSNGSDGFLICRLCCKEEVNHALYVDYVRVLTSLQRQSRADSAALEALTQLFASKPGKFSHLHEKDESWLRNILNGEESLAEFPNASLLHSIKTAQGSEPPLSLLLPMSSGKWCSYWRADPGCMSIEFPVVLGSLSDVSGVILLVSSCGYSSSDCPLVKIWAGNKINREERSCMGEWNVQLLITTSDLYGPETPQVDRISPRHLRFQFQTPVRCRIVWIVLTLQNFNIPSSDIEREHNRLSLSNPFIHAKRLIVYGTPVPHEPLNVLPPENMNINPPKFWRFRVPIESEKLTGNDLVLEQYLPLGSPPLAGFRLDYFNIIKPRIAHSPAFKNMGLWSSSPTGLDDRYINPQVLYMQVSVIQDSQNWVIVKEYRLPEVRAGTIMYFDFPSLIQAEAVAFKLLGDVVAFSDDSIEDEVSLRPLASGLSLYNKVKLYYYADPNDIGRLASFSAV